MADRMRRVNESVRQVLSEAVGQLKDPRIGFVTVTGVETSPDLRHARVFVSVLGAERKRVQTLAGLQAAHSVLQARLARALRRAQVYEGGRIVVSYLLRTDFADVGAAEPYSEGIIDYLRAVEGADMAVLIREPPRVDGPTRPVSLRASVDELDVSAIARKSGGGGHRQAAGFSSEASIEEITDFVRREFLASARA